MSPHQRPHRNCLQRRLSIEPLEARRLLSLGDIALAAAAPSHPDVAPPDFDFGDAPSPYPTTTANNGAQHQALGPTLGPTRDEHKHKGQAFLSSDGHKMSLGWKRHKQHA